MTDKTFIEDIADELDGEDAAQAAFKATYGDAARLERTTLGCTPESGFSYLMPKFARGQAGSDAWSAFIHDPEKRAREEAQLKATAEMYGLEYEPPSE